jgi:hypothetical protein
MERPTTPEIETAIRVILSEKLDIAQASLDAMGRTRLCSAEVWVWTPWRR